MTDDDLMGRALDWADCVCVLSCGDCSLSGVEFHIHPNRYPGDVFGPCPLHPDAPGDL